MDVLPDPVAADVIEAALVSSIALSSFRRVPMPAGTLRLPVLSALPQAYFLDPGASQGDTTFKKTSHAEWAKKTLVAEELAVIVPIPEVILEDSGFDVWGEVTPLLAQAVGQAIDAATIFGVEAPSSFDSIIPGAVAASNTTVKGTASQATGGLAEDFNNLFGQVEDSGFDVSMIGSARTFRASLRGARDTTGQKLLDMSPNGDSVLGIPVTYGAPGLWAPNGAGEGNAAYAIAGDATKAIVGIRRDMTYKLLDQAVLQNTDGTIGYNLPQQDMVALRLVMRLGFVVASPVSYEKQTYGDAFPFAVMTQS